MKTQSYVLEESQIDWIEVERRRQGNTSASAIIRRLINDGITRQSINTLRGEDATKPLSKEMYLDPALIRTILLAVESTEVGDDKPLNRYALGLGSVSWAVFKFHIVCMKDVAIIVTPEKPPADSAEAEVIRLTWAGCDFLDGIRNETVLAELRSKIDCKFPSVFRDISTGENDLTTQTAGEPQPQPGQPESS